MTYLEINATGSRDDSAPNRGREAGPILAGMDAADPRDEILTCDQVFVLRCWRETPVTGAIDPDWRVRLSLVNTRERIHVFGIESAFELIREFLTKAVGTKGGSTP